ncbi:MAG: hypothetical protein HY363_03830 [Candidatus Aenigmarchaeota archaeon]|nr:hypothetical protein [Candidatus Aenigmarchaeota archaeon]
MELNYIILTAGATALLIILHRVILSILALRKFNQNYANELNNILNDKEYKVKGRFD